MVRFPDCITEDRHQALLFVSTLFTCENMVHVDAEKVLLVKIALQKETFCSMQVCNKITSTDINSQRKFS